jgi:hypothetical protein
LPDQLAIPVRLAADGRLATVTQGSDQEIAQRVSVLCHTPPGWLDGRPTTGLAEDTFNPGGADLSNVDQQLRALGPDVLYRITEDPSLMDQGLDSIGLQAGAAA